MKCFMGIWLPDREMHMLDMISLGNMVDGKGTYQHAKLMRAMEHVKKPRRLALDIGMHVGLWSMHLAGLFRKVVGFEPVPEHIECLRKNMNGTKNYEVHQCALGDRVDSVGLKYLTGSTGSTHIKHADEGVPMVPLDQFAFDAVDFMKIDVEGYEYFVVKGAEQTIRTHKPVIIIEQKGGKCEREYGHGRYIAKELLESWGAKQMFALKGDHCLVF